MEEVCAAPMVEMKLSDSAGSGDDVTETVSNSYTRYYNMEHFEFEIEIIIFNYINKAII